MAQVKDTVLANTLLSMGHYFLEKSNYDSSQFYYKKALSHCEQIGYTRGVSMALADLGILEYQNAHYIPAMDYYQRAAKAALNVKNKRDAALITSNIGELNVVLGNTALGIKQIKESENELLLLKDSISLLSVRLQLVQLYSSLGDTVNFSSYLTKAMATFKAKEGASDLTAQDKVKMEGFERTLLYCQANLLRERKQPAAAAVLLKQVVKHLNSGRGKIAVELTLADAYYEMQDYQQALAQCNEALTHLKIDSIPDLYVTAYEIRSDIYESMNQVANAFADFKLAKQIKDSLFSRQMMNKTAGLEAKWEAELKSEQIEYLNKEKKLYKILIGIAVIGALAAGIALVLVYRSRKLQRKLLVQQNEIVLAQKELENNRLQIRLFEQEQAALRAQMNPHFIFNSLNSIQYYVISHDIQGANRYISMLGSLIRLTLDYAAKPTILLREELAYLEKYLALEKMRMQDAFDYRITIPEGLDTEMYEIPPMLLQPFLENALKHGVAYLQNRKGFVELQIEQVGEGLQYTITDNGVGRAVTSQYNSGFATRTHQPKGIQLSEQRIAQLQKDGVMPAINIIDLHDNEGQPSGTQVVIVLP